MSAPLPTFAEIAKRRPGQTWRGLTRAGARWARSGDGTGFCMLTPENDYAGADGAVHHPTSGSNRGW